MVGGEAHVNPAINSGRQIVTNINFIETANIDAINAWVTSPDMMRVNPANLAEIMFGSRRVPSIKG